MGCSKLNLDTSGNKLALIKRIKDALNSQQQEQDEIISNETGMLSNDPKDGFCDSVSNDQDKSSVDAVINEQEDKSIEDWTKQKMIDECSKLNLDSSGNKIALIKRIKDALNSQKQEQDEIISYEAGKISNFDEGVPIDTINTNDGECPN